ncbi:MAG: hypothetical protein M3N52_04405 [Actinomycetota bacterium]|nr:hypothetical protein [Actinomycetota bacterium]
MRGAQRASRDGVVLARAAASSIPSSGTSGVPVRRCAHEALRRVLRRAEDAPSRHGLVVHRAFSASLLLSAARCLLTYLILPFVAPVLGVAVQVGPWVGIPLGGVAVVANVVTIRRFCRVEHRWRWAYTATSLGVIALLVVLVAGDVAELVR